MRFFSSRRRPVYMGSLPFERLRRLDTFTTILESGDHRPLVNDGTSSGFGAVSNFYLELYRRLREGEVFEADPNPRLADPLALARELKSGGYFLNASAMGVTGMSPSIAEAPTDLGQSCLVIAVEWGRSADADTLASLWLEGAEYSGANVRAAQIAVVLAGHLRAMGIPARAHFSSASDIDLERAAILAGLALRNPNGGITTPFFGKRVALAAVTTQAELAADQPLDPHAAPPRLARWLGLGGTRPLLIERRRLAKPMHFGPYPMEKIRRQQNTTTLLHEDEIPQVNSRALFYARGAYGDLGPKIEDEMHRWVRKHPMANAIRPVIDVQVPYQDGDVAAKVDPSTNDAMENARAIKSLCYHLGADIVGIGPAPRYCWYSHDKVGVPITTQHPRAIVLLIDQGADTIEGSTGDDWISGSQSGRAYMRGAEIAGMVARHIRALGFKARSHSNVDSQVLHVPLLLLAGVGELSRIGEVVLNPFLGPRYKSCVITTDMPLDLDAPVNFNLQDMCTGCRKCARECPSSAISFGNKVMFNGYEIWKPDVERCVRYRVTNSKGSSCGRCTKVCPYSHQGLLAHRWILWTVIRWRWARRLLPKLDDYFCYGDQNRLKKWWSDLEILGGKGTPYRTVAAKGVNERPLLADDDKVDRLARGQKIAVYPAHRMPPPNLAEAFPLDRAQAIADAALLETPDEALARRASGGVAPASYTPPSALPATENRKPMVDLQRRSAR